MVIERSSLGFAICPDGLDVFRKIEKYDSFRFGHRFEEIGTWLIENDYHLYLLYRQIVVKNGITYDSDQTGGFFMESEDHHVAFRMRWF